MTTSTTETVARDGERTTLHCRTPPATRKRTTVTESGVRVSVKRTLHVCTALCNHGNTVRLP